MIVLCNMLGQEHGHLERGIDSLEKISQDKVYKFFLSSYPLLNMIEEIDTQVMQLPKNVHIIENNSRNTRGVEWSHYKKYHNIKFTNKLFLSFLISTLEHD